MIDLTFYDGDGKAVRAFAFATFDEAKTHAEAVLRETPAAQLRRINVMIDAATIEEGDKVRWHCHQNGSPVAVIDCEFSRKVAAYRRGRDGAPGEVHLRVLI
jgi:hypothetical protein